MKWILYVLFGILYVLVTFFGMGPVFLADGPMDERMSTLIVVLISYMFLTILLRWLLRKFK